MICAIELQILEARARVSVPIDVTIEFESRLPQRYFYARRAYDDHELKAVRGYLITPNVTSDTILVQDIR